MATTEVATTLEDEASVVSAAAVVLAAVDAGAAYGASVSQSVVTCYGLSKEISLLKDVQLLRIGTRRQRSIERQVQSRLHTLIPRKEGQRTRWLLIETRCTGKRNRSLRNQLRKQQQRCKRPTINISLKLLSDDGSIVELTAHSGTLAATAAHCSCA